MSAFSALDMLFTSDDEQEILRYLTRNPGATLSAIQEATRLSPPRLETTLDGMLARSQVVERLREGRRTFQVHFVRATPSVRNMPESTLRLFNAPDENFLDQLPLTRGLTEAERKELLALAQHRTMVPDEVFLWQAQTTTTVSLLRRGLLRQTRLHQRVAGGEVRYLRPGQWLGLCEAFTRQPGTSTITAVADSQLLVWDAATFCTFVEQHPALSQTVCEALGNGWQNCQQSQQRGQGQLWAVEGMGQQVGTTLVTLNLAAQARHNEADGAGRVLVWSATERAARTVRDLAPNATLPARMMDGVSVVSWQGLDIAMGLRRSEYPLNVQLDMLLSTWLERYDTIICDTASYATAQDGEWADLALQLRARASHLISVTDDPNFVTPNERGDRPQHRPDQTRLLILNRATPDSAITPRFSMVLPADAPAVAEAAAQEQPVMQGVAHSSLARALQELYRRLSLVHTIGIFIPSTIDVDLEVDNSIPVQRALTFLGQRFGGATSSDAEGVWQSDNSGLVTERITVVRTFVSRRDLHAHLESVIAFAADLKREMRQEAVAIDVDSHLVLV